MNTGEIIAKYAKERGKNIHQLAADAGIPYSTLYAVVKRNSTRVGTDIIKRVAAALEVPDYMLLSGDNNINVIHEAESPEELRIERRLQALNQITLIGYLFTTDRTCLSAADKQRVSINLRMLFNRAMSLCDKNTLTNAITNNYHTNKLSQEYQASTSKSDLETSPEFEAWIQHISKFICRYAALNADGRNELEKRLNELERLEEYEDDILTDKVKTQIAKTR